MREIVRPIKVGVRTPSAQRVKLMKSDLSAEEVRLLTVAMLEDGYVLLNTEHGPWLFTVGPSTVATRAWFTLISAPPPGRP